MRLSYSFDQGRLAFQEGKPITVNPYIAGTQDFFNWNIGWRFAARSSTNKK